MQYLPAYFDILKKYHSRLLYIDGFAGRGYYIDQSTGAKRDGSPILALRLIAARPEFAARVDTVFIECDGTYIQELRERVHELCAENPSLSDPVLCHGTFEEHIEEQLNRIQGAKAQLPPTFLFVDPCGVDGTAFNSVMRVLAAERCEVFVFFNVDGIRRILGLSDAGGISPALVSVFGSEERVYDLKRKLGEAESAYQREQAVIDTYRSAIRMASGAQYVLPFRIEAEGRRSTSHFLVHATKNALGFKIMKHVMWEAGRAEGDAEGRLELLQASAGDLRAMMRADLKELSEAILKRLADGPARIEEFYDQWVCRPTDPFTEGCYRRVLLQLEAEGRIKILDRACQNEANAATRRRRKGQPTLGKDYWATLP